MPKRKEPDNPTADTRASKALKIAHGDHKLLRDEIIKAGAPRATFHNIPEYVHPQPRDATEPFQGAKSIMAAFKGLAGYRSVHELEFMWDLPVSAFLSHGGIRNELAKRNANPNFVFQWNNPSQGSWENYSLISPLGLGRWWAMNNNAIMLVSQLLCPPVEQTTAPSTPSWVGFTDPDTGVFCQTTWTRINDPNRRPGEKREHPLFYEMEFYSTDKSRLLYRLRIVSKDPKFRAFLNSPSQWKKISHVPINAQFNARGGVRFG